MEFGAGEAVAGGMVSGGGVGNASRQSGEVWEICEQSGRSLKRQGGCLRVINRDRCAEGGMWAEG